MIEVSPHSTVKTQNNTTTLVRGLTEITGLDIDGRVKKTELDIAGVDNDGRIWASGCNQLKITIERFYQLTGTYDSFESVLCLKTYEIHIDKQKL